MKKPRWATSPRKWEEAKTAIRRRYGINKGSRFDEMVEAHYMVAGGGVHRPGFAKSEEVGTLVFKAKTTQVKAHRTKKGFRRGHARIEKRTKKEKPPKGGSVENVEGFDALNTEMTKLSTGNDFVWIGDVVFGTLYHSAYATPGKIPMHMIQRAYPSKRGGSKGYWHGGKFQPFKEETMKKMENWELQSGYTGDR